MAAQLGHLDALHGYQDAFLEAIGLVDPAAPVRWCGDWTVADLVVHLARVHHWAAAKVRNAPEQALGNGPSDLAALYAGCAAELREALAGVDPDARAWTLLDDGVPPEEQVGTVRFWHRRQALETLIHTWDLRTAGGLEFDPGPEAWLDCLDEVVTVMHPRQVRLERVPPPATRVRFEPDEGASFWLTGAPVGAPAVIVGGPAKSVALLAWGRARPDDPALRIAGDRAGLDALLADGLTP